MKLLFSVRHNLLFSLIMHFSISTALLRPIGSSKSIGKTNTELSRSFLSRASDAKLTIFRWAQNKIFVLICVSKGKIITYFLVKNNISLFVS